MLPFRFDIGATWVGHPLNPLNSQALTEGKLPSKLPKQKGLGSKTNNGQYKLCDPKIDGIDNIEGLIIVGGCKAMATWGLSLSIP